MSRKVPVRMCIGCQTRKPKKELIRIIYNKKTGEIKVDPSGKLPGRGAYICPDKGCLKKAKKGNRLNKSLKTSISDEIYTKLMEEIDKMNG
ncbi:RNase P modulator RnpM [Halothermothrix orenii]|uniref:Predicted nucleic-acid-binding protein implicated in transcription termination n=1 Tax=Halothermothrix orenii (strain H 168 / OCM 544 / DSM 9562) TaxID=373903 RepID=B8CW71_HALOH|nr:YlxR family protein [Halothermothrix orenii]ACL69540.1 predicted nucleic-acid-binding protein implicated in transcription termination [Halothermothrix orenii H 168]